MFIFVCVCVSDLRVADGRGAVEAGAERSVPAGVHQQRSQQEADAADRHTARPDQEPTAAAGCEWTHIEICITEYYVNISVTISLLVTDWKTS